MRIKKGDQVEVWTLEAASPVGAWRVGEVTWGNGHSYTMRWHDGDGEVSGRISRKSVRPRPPPAPVPRDLDAGDMVEVFDDDDCLWKCAEVQDAAADDGDRRRFNIKIVGAAKVLTVPPQRLRIRQVFRDDDVWVALHKDNQIAVASTMPFHANGGKVGMGIGRGKGGCKPKLPGFTPLLQKRRFGMLGSNTIANGKRFEDTAKRFCAKEEPRYEVEAIVPNVFLNKQDEMSSEDCDVVGAGSNANDGQHHQQHENEVDDQETDSESASSSDDSSSNSSNSSDSRTRSIEAGKDCEAAPAIRHCNDQKADQLQVLPREEEHCDNLAESREIKHDWTIRRRWCRTKSTVWSWMHTPV
nr:unnamed protein product [Digitaria exilis]